MALKQRDSGEKYVVRYADGCRLCHVFILAPIFAAMTAFWIYVFTQIDDGKSMFFLRSYSSFYPNNISDSCVYQFSRIHGESKNR